MKKLTLLLAGMLVACKAPTVNLGTADPIKVDIDMRLDVYQHADKKAAPSTISKPAPASDPASRRRNRMADIQTFKNERLVGEAHDGMVAIVKIPDDSEYADYVRKTVQAENEDRLAQIKDLAETRKTSLVEIQKEQAALWRNRSFAGEWIEVQGEDATWTWKPKEG